MFLIVINDEDEPKLHTSGVAVTINGQPQSLKSTGEYLLYNGNRCEVLVAANPDSVLSVVCGSHVAENESVCGAEAGESAATEELPSDDAHERLIAMICEQWNGRGTCAAVDAVQDLLVETEPEFCAPVIRAICRLSRSWTEQIASDLLEVPNEVSGEFLGLAKALEASTPSKNKEVENDHAKMP